MIARLVQGLDADSYRLLRLSGELQIPRGSRFGVQIPNAAIGIVTRARRIARILREQRCEVIVAASGDAYDLPAAYLASQKERVPFVAYYFDDYVYQAWHPVTRWVSRQLEPRFLRHAAAVIAPNEAMRDELRRRRDVDSVIIRNPCDVGAYDMAVEPRDRHRIVYTGAVAESHYDAFRNLLRAIESTPYHLHIYTAQSPDALRALGIDGQVTFHEHRDASEMPRVQREAGILFMPLAFESRYPVLIRTSSPGKLAEYLAAGRPILAHVPEDSFVARFLREHDCGRVVSDPALLRSAIEEAEGDEARAARARRLAREEFSIEIARERFLDVLRRAVSR